MLTKILLTAIIFVAAMLFLSYGRGRKKRQVDHASNAAAEATRRRVQERMNLMECPVCKDFASGRCHREDCGLLEPPREGH
ncbi:MAG TPA: hypothetical protein DHV03_00805 [Alphaproteobacteria bacterium]|jgi:hypothetical protein|nr:hypothetical protein [Paracoccaceae bacterium]RCL80528.1 MAG: hypothetical protein DBW67_03640 [SAR116 cluster bacterium]HBQ23300.1 hypothetical protein [Alphaproteobacteria bacterium]HCY47195.1 hypothetical protein [Alphaproteobacteria bacterium]|tara:strand:- start:1706 stop:1948 length:243 start_codon:yes stop_codon:yes gene_type:complete